MEDLNKKLRDNLIEKFEKLKGQFVLNYYEVVRLIGVEEVPNDDFYYILTDGKSISYASVLTRLIPLKGKLDEKDYNELVRVAKLNAMEHKTVYYELDDPDYYLNYRSRMEEKYGKYAITDFAWIIN